MIILVLNCGSSSVKFQLFDMAAETVLAKGLVDKIGLEGSLIKMEKADCQKIKIEKEIKNHPDAIEYALELLTDPQQGVITDLSVIQAVGHRVAHGGEKFSKSSLITTEVADNIENCIELAPLHNPANLTGIKFISCKLPEVPQVAVFDTAFHQTMPKHAFMYAISNDLYEKHGIRRYGFHGTSHKYVANRACDILGVDIKTKKIISCHLGNGASIAAIENGISVDTSMGFTPVEGLIMGTRCGDIDAGVLTFIMDKEKIDAIALNRLLNTKSGVYGISEVSSDMREIEVQAMEYRNPKAQLALDMYHYRVRKYIGAYAAAMNGVDIIIFTGGIGENGPESREEICKELSYLGADFDQQVNFGVKGKELIISKKESKVMLMVVPTNEELEIARDTRKIISELN